MAVEQYGDRIHRLGETLNIGAAAAYAEMDAARELEQAAVRRARMVNAMTELFVLTKRAERLHRAFERAAAEQDWARTNATARAFFRLIRPAAG